MGTLGASMLRNMLTGKTISIGKGVEENIVRRRG